MTNENKTQSLTLDEIDTTDDEQFQRYLDGLNAEDTAQIPPEKTKPAKPIQEQKTKTAETQIKDEITKYEKTNERLRAELKREFSAETLKAINDNLAKVGKLKENLQYETQLREKYAKLFEGKITETDFWRLWETKLRDEALTQDRMEKTNAVKLASRHSIYSRW